MFAAMYLGTGFPRDILGALFLGWGMAAAVHLVFGSPGGRPTTAQVEASLVELGVDADDVHLDPVQPTGSSRFLARDASGPLEVRVIGRDEADAQFLSKLWRFLIYKDSGPHLYLSREQDVEHEAYTLLLAQRAGVHVPEVLVAGTAGPGAALIVERGLDGRYLSELDTDEVSDELLTGLWRQVGALHDRAGRARVPVDASHPDHRRRHAGHLRVPRHDDRRPGAAPGRRPRRAPRVDRGDRGRRPRRRRLRRCARERRPR